MTERIQKMVTREKKTVYVLDTTVLIDDPDIFYKLGDALIVVSTAVIRELDGHKKSGKEHIARAARKVSRFLDNLSSYSDIAAGAKISTGGVIMITPQYELIDDLASEADNRIVGAAIYLKRDYEDVELLTTDTNMRTVARVYGIKGEFYAPVEAGDIEYIPDEARSMDRENIKVLARSLIFSILTFITLYAIFSVGTDIDGIGVAFFFAVVVFIVSGSIMGYEKNKGTRAVFSDSRLKMDKKDPTADPHLSGYYGIDSKR